MKKRTKNIIVIALILVIAALLITFGGNRNSDSAQSEDIARMGDLTTYYTFSGSVEVENSQRISATAAATVRDVYVSKNDNVLKNDRILRLSTGETIKATINGEVATLNVEKDDEVNPGDLLAEVIDFDHLEFQIKVDEFDAHAISPGKEVELTINALNRTITSEIKEISKQAVKIGDISYYMATILPPEDMDGVLPGMQVDVRVQNEKVENALLAPMKAILFDDYGSPYVTIKDSSGRALKSPVQVGINDGVQVQVLSGVTNGDTLLIPSTAQYSGAPLFDSVRGE